MYQTAQNFLVELSYAPELPIIRATITTSIST